MIVKVLSSNGETDNGVQDKKAGIDLKKNGECDNQRYKWKNN